MPPALRPERRTQNRVIQRITTPVAQGGLGYAYLGDWSHREGNRCVEQELLRANLAQRGYGASHISQALTKLSLATDVTGRTLYQANLETYRLLRYGVPVLLAAGGQHETVHLVDWANPANNHFALAEEVTLLGGHERRPDIVLYINGLAVAVLELKRSSVDISNGIRQLITNQEALFNQDFFSTVQLVLAGSDSQGLRYGTVGTAEKFFVAWKDTAPVGAQPATGEGALLNAPLAQLLEPARLLDLIRNFIIFDAGIKKVPRPHQYLGIKAAQARVEKREGGVIWHTQGSGKSILMVLLAKWLLEHDAQARVLVITDRDELDKQIEGVMRNAGVIGENAPSPRIQSRKDLETKLGEHQPRLMCSLIHKINIQDLKGEPPRVAGRFYVFVDECHRTQSGDMNKQMKRWLSDAIFIGFTGTPLLRRDKQTTAEVFGSFIHTYKFNEAVADQVVLDLKYEARNIEQRLTSREAIDAWFETKTQGLNNFQKSALRKRWATMEQLMSSGERKQRIVADVIHDFGVKPRLNSNRGTAILVTASIYDACHYFRLFRNTNFGNYCGLVTSFQPNATVISQEPPESDERYKFDTYTQHVLSHSQTTAQYETEMKRRFIEEPANLKLLIVVSKLLTGFDAPSCTYIYLDNDLRDHNLFQAICRTNRLDGEDKPYGHIVDYKALFIKLQDAVAVYTSDELDTETCGADANVNLKDWLKEGRERLDASREALGYLCAPVVPPQGLEEYIHYFCGDTTQPTALGDTEPLRIALYKAVAVFVRALSEIASNLPEAGYSPAQAAAIEAEALFYSEVRAAIKNHAGEELDIKPFEADMRHLINTYIQADPADPLGDLEKLSLTELIIETGIHDAIAKKLNVQGRLSENTVAEGIVNNVRKTIIREQLTDPRFYEQMSVLLDDLIEKKRSNVIAYEEFLQEAARLVQKLARTGTPGGIPTSLVGNQEAVVLFNNLGALPAVTFQYPTADEDRASLALRIDAAVRDNAPADWKGNPPRESMVLNAIHPLLDRDRDATLALFDIIKRQPGY